MIEQTLELRRLQTHFETEDGVVKAVNDVSLTVGAGRVLAVVGESGSGKSVMGFSILGLIDLPGRIVGGEILYRGRNIAGLPEPQMRRIRGNRIAMIFQDPMMTLNPVLRIEDQMIEAILSHNRVPRSEARVRCIEALGRVGVPNPEARIGAYPHQFSGGMRQRVAIAIALLNSPDLIIADEPTTALDVTIQAQILAEVQQIIRERGTALMWITHDLSVVAGLADDIAVMYAGQVVEEGPAGRILRRPSHPYTYGLLRSIPSRSRRGAKLFQIPGTTPSLLNLDSGCPFRWRCEHATDICDGNAPLTELEQGRRVRCFHPHMEATL